MSIIDDMWLEATKDEPPLVFHKFMAESKIKRLHDMAKENGMLISTTFGNETFDNSTCKYHLFACRTEFFPLVKSRQMQLWLAAKEGIHSISIHGRLIILPAVPGADYMGKWTTAAYNIPDGFVLKIFGSRSLRAGLGRSLVTANLYIQTRENGPLIGVAGRLSGNEKAGQSEVLVFSGRADILTDEEIKDLGLEMYKPYNQSNIEALFHIETLAPESGNKPEVVEREIENTSGQKQIIKSIVRKRAIQL